MRRLLAGLGIVAAVAAAPVALNATAGGPGLPAAGSFGGLDSTYMPLEPVLAVLAQLAWLLWAYVVVAVLLRVIAIVIARRTGSTALVRATDRFAPRPLRRLVDLAVGGVFLASTFPVGRAVALPAPAPAIAVVAPTHSAPAKLPPKKEVKRYVVRPGDSLWAIAERELGSGFRWKEIFKENRGRAFPNGRCLENPRLIHPGWTLRLPANGIRPEAEQNHGKPPKEASSPTLGPASPTPDASAEAPAPTLEAEQTLDAEPSLGSSTAGEPAEAASERPDASDVSPRPSAPVVKLPSGAIVATSFACGVLSAELLTRLRRRRARRPLAGEQDLEIPERLVRDLRHAGAAPTAAPIDVAIDEVVAAWHAHTGRWPRILAAIEGRRKIEVVIDAAERALPKPSGGQMSPALRFERAGPVVRAEVRGPFPMRLRRVATPMQRGLLAPLGHAGSKTAVHIGVLGAGVISIEGPDRIELVRQMILSLATEASTDDLQVAILGADPPTIAGLPHVWRKADWDGAGDAIQEIQAEFIRRARLFQREGVEDISEHLAEHGDEHLPGILIVAVEPPAPMRSVLDAIAHEAPRFGAATLAIGWRPSLRGIHIDADQDALAVETDLPIPPRLAPFTLDEETIRDAERLIRQVALDEATGASVEDSSTNEGGVSPDNVTVLDTRLPEPPLRTSAAEQPPEPALGVTAVRPPAIATVDHVPPQGKAAIHCLGHPTVTRDGKSRPKGWHTKARELLAYLIAHPEGATKERITADLWPDENDATTLQNVFNKAIYNIRRQVREQDDPGEYVIRDDDFVRLDGGAWWIDAFAFANLIVEAERSPDEEAMKLRQALALYRGDFCGDTYYPWAEPSRERYRALFTRASARLAEVISAEGQHDEALDMLEHAIQADPLCEDLWRRAMKIEAALGRRGAALERFNRLQALLAHELSVEPDPETQRLVREMAARLPDSERRSTTSQAR